MGGVVQDEAPLFHVKVMVEVAGNTIYISFCNLYQVHAIGGMVNDGFICPWSCLISGERQVMVFRFICFHRICCIRHGGQGWSFQVFCFSRRFRIRLLFRSHRISFHKNQAFLVFCLQVVPASGNPFSCKADGAFICGEGAGQVDDAARFSGHVVSCFQTAAQFGIVTNRKGNVV